MRQEHAIVPSVDSAVPAIADMFTATFIKVKHFEILQQ